MKMIVATAMLAVGMASPAFAQEQDSTGWRAGAQSSELQQHRADAFVQSIRDLPQYMSEPAWQAYAQYRRANGQGAFAQGEIRGQRLAAGNASRLAYASARRVRAQDAYAMADTRDQRPSLQNRTALRAYMAQYRSDAEQNPLNAYAQNGLRDYRVRSGYAPWHVYDTTGEYVGSDPDPLIRNELARDPPNRSE